ncbi:MAG: hypothetical protein ABW224_12760 [Kibdelosporangium sp.]
MDDGESRHPDQPVRFSWVRAVVTSWSSAFRVGFLVLLLLIVLVAVRLLALEVSIGPVVIGSS